MGDRLPDEPPPGSPPAPGDDATPLRVLLVDDEPRFREALTRRLGLRGLDVVAAASGAEALSIARARELDVALVDLKMPEMGGLELQQALATLQPCVEVIILTGHGAAPPPASGSSPPLPRRLQKPCETRELMAVLMDAGRRTRRRRARGRWTVPRRAPENRSGPAQGGEGS